MKIIPYGKQSINNEDIDSVCSVLRSDWLTQGPKGREFEEALCRETGAKHCVVVASGTLALYLACKVLNIGHGHIGLTSPISFMASANCIAYCDGTPDFVDIDPTTLCISPEKTEAYCNSHEVPKVVIPVDFAGIPADLPGFKVLSERYGFKLIEDAAHAIGSTYFFDGKKYACGSCAHTDMAIFSFHPVKTITTGEGGAILTNNLHYAKQLRLLANHGIEKDPSNFANLQSIRNHPKSFTPWYHEMKLLGFNGRITDLQCALGISQLKRLNHFKHKRQEIFRAYNDAFKELAEKHIAILPKWPQGVDPCYHLYTFRIGPNCKISRDKVFLLLQEKKIYCQVHYIPIYRQPFYQKVYGYQTDRFPEAEKYFSTCLSLPLFPDMNEETVQWVVENIHSILIPRGV